MGKPIWGKWPWQCTTTGLDDSTELRMEKIRQAVTEIWVPQVWQPPARPLARPSTRPLAHPPARLTDCTVTTIPLQPGGLWGKKKISRSWPRSKSRHSVQLIYLFFVLWQAIYSWDMTIPYLTLKIQGQDQRLQGQNLWSHLMPRMQSIYSFFICGNQTIFSWDMANFNRENYGSISWPK